MQTQTPSLTRSLLIGLAAGSRAMTPIATVSDATARGVLPGQNPDFLWLGHPLATAVLKTLAALELWGDKLHSAPDRTVPAGLAARIVTSAIAGAALAPRKRAVLGAALGAGAAVGAAYLTFALRMRALRHYGQASTGVIEDALTIAAAQSVVASPLGRRR